MSDTLAALVKQCNEWLSNGGLFNPVEMTRANEDATRRLILDVREALAAIVATQPEPETEPRAWLIYDKTSECFWGPNRGGYWKSISNAGLYTEQEAREAEDLAKRYGRGEVAVPLSKFGAEIKRLSAASSEQEAIDSLLGVDRLAPHPQTLECPCCGDDGAIANAKGEFFDGQPLTCGCLGHVNVEEDGDVWINNGDVPCPKCAPYPQTEKE